MDNIVNLNLLSKQESEEAINFKLNKNNILITFHPVPLEKSTAHKQFNELLLAVDEQKNTTLIFTKANSDTDGRIINQMIDEYVQKNTDKAVCFTSLGQLRYLSALQYMDMVVGNSSSGLAEVPTFKKATIHIGDRQKGRIKAESVINCLPIKNDILNAFKVALSKDFGYVLQGVENPYGNGGASQEVKDIIKKMDLTGILKKSFYNFLLPIK